MLWPIIFMLVTVVLTNNKAFIIEAKTLKTKSNFFDPILSSSAYVGRISEHARIVELEPSLSATDADPSSSPNGQICGYELSLYKHDLIGIDEVSQNIPFTIELIDGKSIVQVKNNINKLDCELKQTYHLFVRAYDCANNNERRYSERSFLTITVIDVNEFAPAFTHKNYLFKLHQEQNCVSCRVEATDDDCSNIDHRVCGYEIKTPNTPFSIDFNGSISIKTPLTDDKYEFDVVAIDCNNKPSLINMTEPAHVTIKIVKSCQPMITDNNPTKLSIRDDHTHIFETVHVDLCEETCPIEDITATITLDSNGIDSGCNLEQCTSINREYTLIEKDVDSNQAPQKNILSFDGFSQATTVPKVNFSGQIKDQFIIRMWMKHAEEDSNEKEHIFCKTDEKFKNRHHMGLFIQDGYLKLLIRVGPLSVIDKKSYASLWAWKLSQINDNEWHSYKLFFNTPTSIDLYIDDQLFIALDENFKVIEDFALPIIEGTGDTIFAVGACWHARASHMTQYFHGQLSGLTIEQKEEFPKSMSCIQDCQQYLDMPDMQSQLGIEFTSNSNRSVWNLRTDSSEIFEELLKHIVYRNTFQPVGPSGQRIVSIQATLKCLNENFTYSLPTFTRRLSIDEIPHPSNIELKGDTNYFISEQIVSQGIYLFGNLSITTDASEKDQIDLSDCSINTSPDLTDDEKLLVSDDSLKMNNIQKDLTQNGLMLSGISSIESYQKILRNIAYISKSPTTYTDRLFSLICIGTHNQIPTNEIQVRIHIEKQVAAPAAQAASLLSKQFVVDNDQMRDTLFDIAENTRPLKNVSGWPIVVVICVSVGLASVLVLFLVVRIRSGNRQRSPLTGTNDDTHSQMEWEDDIGLNIIVNPLDTTKKPVQSMSVHDMNETIHKYDGTTSDEEEYDEHTHNEYSSDEDDDDYEEEDDYVNNRIHAKNGNHQLEWDDEAMEYGPKKV